MIKQMIVLIRKKIDIIPCHIKSYNFLQNVSDRVAIYGTIRYTIISTKDKDIKST